jgi:hypothetical protein
MSIKNGVNAGIKCVFRLRCGENSEALSDTSPECCVTKMPTAKVPPLAANRLYSLDVFAAIG